MVGQTDRGMDAFEIFYTILRVLFVVGIALAISGLILVLGFKNVLGSYLLAAGTGCILVPVLVRGFLGIND